MTSIHPIAYMIIGAVIAGYSKFVTWRNPESYLDPFFYVGLFFILVGVVKLVFRKLNKESEVKEKKFEQQVNSAERQFNQGPFNTYDPNRDKEFRK